MIITEVLKKELEFLLRLAVMLLWFLDVLFSYRDQFAMLAEGIARERYEMEVRDKAQEKVSYRPHSISFDCTRFLKW